MGLFLFLICYTAVVIILYPYVAVIASHKNEIQVQPEGTNSDKSHSKGLCPDVRRPLPESARTNGGWQIQDSGDDRLVVYSAFYDDRPAVGVTPWIRIIGVARLTPGTHYCHLWYAEREYPYVKSAVVDVIGRQDGYTIQGTTYIQYLFSCQVPDHETMLPTHVSVVADRCAKSSIYLPVERPARGAEPDVEFGVCVAVSFGHIPTPVFAEWIELTWMLGAREFNVYDTATVNMSAVFDHYVRRGWLRLRPMRPPVTAETFSSPPPVNRPEHPRVSSANLPVQSCSEIQISYIHLHLVFYFHLHRSPSQSDPKRILPHPRSIPTNTDVGTHLNKLTCNGKSWHLNDNKCCLC